MRNRNKKYYQTLLLLLTLLIIHSSLLIATVRFVSKTGNSTPPYITWETAADSIQKCINMSVFGDTIYVANGVYEEQVVMIPGLSLIGAGTDSCIIDTRDLVTSQNYRAVETADSSLFTGFYILVYNNSDWGIGVAVDGNSLVISNKISQANQGILNGSDAIIHYNIFNDVGIGISLSNSNASVKNNIIYTSRNDQLVYTAGIEIDAFSNSYYPTIDSNYIEIDHIASYGIDMYLGSSPTITNNIIYSLKSGLYCIGSGIGGTSKICNNLIIAVSAYDGIYKNGSVVHAMNNYLTGLFHDYGILVGPNDIVKNNVVTYANRGIGAWANQNLIVQYNNSWHNGINCSGFTPDTTNLSVDPMIVNNDTTQGELDFHLQKYSPLIDAGDPNILDKDGTRSDIGLYGGPYGESYFYQDLAPKPPRGLFAIVDGSIITLTWNRNTESDFNHYNLYRDTTSNFQIDSTKLVASLTDTFYYHIIPIGVESLYFKLTAVDNQGNESNPSEEVAVILVSVKNEWKPVSNYILYKNYPNPFNPTTTIGYKLKERAYVKLYVYDVKGELVEVLVNQTQEAGYYEVEFNGDGKTELIKVKNPFVSGVYLCQIIIQSEKGIPVFSDIKKMILLK
jgi:hypothetical protein